MESHQQLSSLSFYPTSFSLINSYHLHHSTPLRSPAWFVFNPNGISSAVIIFIILPHFFLLRGLSSILMESHQQLSSSSFYPTPSSCVNLISSYHLHHSTPLLSPAWFVFNNNGISSAVIIFTILPHFFLLRGNLISSYHLHHSTPLLSPVWFVFNPNGISSAVIIFIILPHFFLLRGLSSILMESHQQLSSSPFYPTSFSCVLSSSSFYPTSFSLTNSYHLQLSASGRVVSASVLIFAAYSIWNRVPS
ncbi:hypothetical protein RRG08_067233 [Elysia crispata]|uniref:Uncharacterized protein n=1 Tax=Elysia crispata TaxID=231223 RepID=A0AAE1AAU7_9GAST|nr:hypothetical protein RRG08_067233 [Elysia crispata]